MQILFTKILKCIALSILLIIAGLATTLLFFIIGESGIVVIVSMIVIILLFAWGFIGMLGLFRPKTFLIVFICFTSIIGISTVAYRKYDNYIRNIPVLEDQEVDLRKYEPFAENTKAVRLDEPSTLQLTGELPIIDGATALYPLYAAFVQATYPEEEFLAKKEIVNGETTPIAYTWLLNENVDLIFCARPSQKQIRKAKNEGKQFMMNAIGREAFVFFVNKNNPVEELTIEQIKGIYSGKITNWKEVGGKNDEIKAYQRPENSGSQTMLEYIMEDTPIMPPLETIAAGMGDIINYTANYKNYKNAIGYSFLFFATEMVKNNEIKLLKINGISPSSQTIRSGEYPFTDDFYAIRTDTLNENVEKLIEWILSPQGQYLVEKTGYIPIK